MHAQINKSASLSTTALDRIAPERGGRRISLGIFKLGRQARVSTTKAAQTDRSSFELVDDHRAETLAKLTCPPPVIPTFSSAMQADIGAVRDVVRLLKQYVGIDKLPQARTHHFQSHEADSLWLALQDGSLLIQFINALIPAAQLPFSLKYHPTSSLSDISTVADFLDQHFQISTISIAALQDPSSFNQVLHCLKSLALMYAPKQTNPRHPKALSSPPSQFAINKFEESLPSPTTHVDLRTAKRASAIVIRSRHDDRERRKHMFYGLDRRLSESALDLPAVSESEEGTSPDYKQTRRPVTPRSVSMSVSGESAIRQNPIPHSFSGSSSNQNIAGLPTSPLSKSFGDVEAPPRKPLKSELRRPSQLNRSFSTPQGATKYASIDVEIQSSYRRPRPLSATSSASVPFPSSPDVVNIPRSRVSAPPGRPSHHRWNSDLVPNGRRISVQTARRQSSDFDSGSSSDGRPNRRVSVVPSRHRIVVKEAGKPIRTYQLGDCIGRGQFGSVYRSLNLDTGRFVAVKRIRLAGKSEEEISQLAVEVDLLKSVSHPSIVSYEGLLRTENYLNILLEYVENGSLLDTLKTFGIFPETLVASYTLQILEGLQYLHSLHIVHCDLKCANVLLSKHGNVKIGDFGVSLNLNTIKNKNDVELPAGTPQWMAPEIIQLHGASTASDIWSLACVIVEMLTGKPPYADMISMAALYHIVEDELPPLPAKASHALQDFLSQCFAKLPDDRPSADMLFDHAWLQVQWDSVKEQRPQDSIPFISRLSSSLRRPGLSSSGFSDPPPLEHSPASVLSSSITTPPASLISPEALPRDSHDGSFLHVHDFSSSSEGGHRSSLPRILTKSTQTLPTAREHTFVKTSFSKVVSCRLCQLDIKRHGKASLCDGCGLICHATCSSFATDVCDLRSSLLNYSSKPVDSVGRALPSVSMPSLVSSPTLPSLFLKVKKRASKAVHSSNATPIDSGFSHATNRSNSSAGDSGIGSPGLPPSPRKIVYLDNKRSFDNTRPSKLRRRESAPKEEGCTIS